MNYAIKLISLSALLMFASCTKKEPTTAEDMCLQGKVKTLVEYQYRAVEKFGEVVQGDPHRPDQSWDLRYEFDNKGFCKKVHLMTPEGDDVGSIEYFYDAAGRKVIEKNFDSEGNFIDELTFKYDDEGRLVKTQKFLTDNNPAGNIIYEYKDNTKSTKHYNFRGELLQSETQTLSKHNFPLETKIFGKEGDLISWRKEKYSVDGLREKLIGYEDDGTVAFEVNFTYDKYGNILSQTGDDIVPITTEYTYDDHGNWIKSVTREDGVPCDMFIRTITYYGTAENSKTDETK
ncbi:MAG: hypothetical protein MJZ19_09860 [Paludibacteraceae bacterium]|nr:hypothetical protein [Paludibacteraceae bacterium]